MACLRNEYYYFFPSHFPLSIGLAVHFLAPARWLFLQDDSSSPTALLEAAFTSPFLRLQVRGSLQKVPWPAANALFQVLVGVFAARTSRWLIFNVVATTTSMSFSAKLLSSLSWGDSSPRPGLSISPCWSLCDSHLPILDKKAPFEKPFCIVYFKIKISPGWTFGACGRKPIVWLVPCRKEQLLVDRVMLNCFNTFKWVQEMQPQSSACMLGRGKEATAVSHC